MKRLVVGALAVVLILLFVLKKWKNDEPFSQFYVIPQRGPKDYIRHPLEYRK